MNLKFRLLSFFLLAALVFSCGSQGPESEGIEMISADKLKAHIRYLSDDLMEGRGTGSRGLKLAGKYMAAQFAINGVQPGGENSTYFQAVPLVGYTATAPLRFEFVKGGQRVALRYLDDFVANAGRIESQVRLTGDIVFVGYGVDAPDLNWNDYKDVDVSDKILLMLVNDPPSEDPEFFGGKALTYFGRWTYKNEIAGKKGAAGVILIHTDEKAGYGWGVVRSSWSGEQFALEPKAGAPPKSRVESWITSDMAERLLGMAGYSLEEMINNAGKSDFRPVELGVSLNIDMRSRVRNIESQNVIGIVPGVNSEEYVVYSTHLDHLGIGNPINGDNIYNGALDNSTGSAALLEIGRVFAHLSSPPERSVVLVAVTGEEKGLLGSTYYAQNPVYPANKTIANINFDSPTKLGRFRDMVVLGAERTSAYELAEKLASDNGLILSPDPAPEQGSYFRSDQLSFARVGIPGLYIKNGHLFEGRSDEWGAEQAKLFNENHYHQPSDEFSDDWDMEGILQLSKLAFQFGFRIAGSGEWIEWNDGEAFKAVREGSIKN
ncbi:M28 family peptidase [candidate division KSB1 bacterium]